MKKEGKKKAAIWLLSLAIPITFGIGWIAGFHYNKSEGGFAYSYKIGKSLRGKVKKSKTPVKSIYRNKKPTITQVSAQEDVSFIE